MFNSGIFCYQNKKKLCRKKGGCFFSFHLVNYTKEYPVKEGDKPYEKIISFNLVVQCGCLPRGNCFRGKFQPLPYG